MESTITTEAKVTLYTFNWKISPFDIICPEKCSKFDRLSSGHFTVKEDDGTESQWSVYIKGSSDYLGLFLNFKCAKNADGTDHSERRCEFTMSIGSDENNRIGSSTEYAFRKDEDWGWTDFLEIGELYRKRETLLQNNTLHVCVRMRIYGKYSTTVALLLQPEQTVNTLEVLSVELGEMFNNKKNSDVEIICGNDETFYAHKLILSARSKVFSAMLDSDMQETVTSKIILNDIGAAEFHAILWYIYTGKVGVNDTISYAELIYGAEKCDLSELKQYCFEQMCKDVTVKTIGNLAVAAEVYNADEKTKQSIREYCQRNIAALMKDPAIRLLMISHPKAFF